MKIPNDTIKTENLTKVYIGKVAYAAGKYVRIYLKYFWVLSVIPLSVSTKLIFRRFNFIEHLAINSFILGQATIVGLLSYIVFKINLPINPLVYLLILWLTYRIFITKKIR